MNQSVYWNVISYESYGFSTLLLTWRIFPLRKSSSCTSPNVFMWAMLLPLRWVSNCQCVRSFRTRSLVSMIKLSGQSALVGLFILLMVQKSGDHQLRLVVYPIIYKDLYIPGGAGFLPSTVCMRDSWGWCMGNYKLKWTGWLSSMTTWDAIEQLATVEHDCHDQGSLDYPFWGGSNNPNVW